MKDMPPGIVVLDPKVFRDERGFFFEIWNEKRLADAGVSARFVQDNLSSSAKGVLRGLHLQHPSGQGKLVTVLQGEVYDVVVDVRVGSPDFGRWSGYVLSSENCRQLYIPPGFAHGFVVRSDSALFHYKCTDFYRPEHELTVLWNDPDIGIDWPVAAPLVSAKDQAGRRLRDIPADRLPSCP